MSDTDELTRADGILELAAYVGAESDPAVYSGFTADCWDRADELVCAYVGSAPVPAPVLALARLNVGAELYARRNAPSGIAQFATPGDAAPLRLARDPMAGVYPILSRYTGLGVA